MFLLIPEAVCNFLLDCVFTFHTVSINSIFLPFPFPHLRYLHSTMFLLIPTSSEESWNASEFTFHNVSINSIHQKDGIRQSASFTFHNVSINSRYLIFLIFPTFSLLFLSTLDSICVFPLYSHLKIIIYLLFMPLSMSPVFYFIEHRQFYNFIFLTAYAISFNFLNVYSYFSTYQQTHCNIIKLQLRIIFFILNRLWT